MTVVSMVNRYSCYLVQCGRKEVVRVQFHQNLLTLHVVKECFNALMPFLKQHTNTQYTTLLDIVITDYPLQKQRFTVVYLLLSVNRNSRIYIKSCLTQLSSLTSVTHCYAAAGGFEREAGDLFGVFFQNNYDLRRILTDYGFEGHPFRKDFPLSGYVELRYDENQKRIISEFIEISQEYRHFDFL